MSYEVHQFAASGRGAALQRHIVANVGSVIAITPPLRGGSHPIGGAPTPTASIVAHDGFRRARFEPLPDQASARRQIGWRQEAFIVGYVGRLHTLGLDKGVGTLVEALAAIDGVCLAVVGGPADMADALRRRWLAIWACGARTSFCTPVRSRRMQVPRLSQRL